VIDFLVQIVQTEVPDSHIAIIASHAHEDHNIPAIIREQGLAHLLGGPLARTSRLIGLIFTAFSALFPENVKSDSIRKWKTCCSTSCDPRYTFRRLHDTDLFFFHLCIPKPSHTSYPTASFCFVCTS
jgi:hypothetical protein